MSSPGAVASSAGASGAFWPRCRSPRRPSMSSTWDRSSPARSSSFRFSTACWSMPADPPLNVPKQDGHSATEEVTALTGRQDQTAHSARQHSRRDASPVSTRALLIGLAFVIYFAAGGPGGVGGFHLAPGSLVVLFLLAAVVNPLLQRLRQRPLKPEELIVIWTMLAVALVNDLSFYLPVTLV